MWLQFAEGAGFERWRPFVEALDDSLPRIPLQIVIAQRDLDAAQGVFPSRHPIPAPADEQQATRLALKAFPAGEAVYLGDRRGLPHWLWPTCQEWGREFFVVEEEQVGQAQDQGDGPAENRYRVHRMGRAADGRPALAADAAASQVANVIVEKRRGIRNANATAASKADARPSSVDIGSRIGRFRSRRIDSLDALNDRLARPNTIACLGSGPSAEDPRVHDVQFDSLFRVNMRWRDRGFLDDPDVIFTWRPEVVPIKPHSTFGLHDILLENEFIASRFPWRVLGPAFEYFTCERLPILLNRWHGDAIPSTGALMLDVAAALKPKRLIVAGFDLFTHPGGAYPGDTETPNAYDIAHDRQNDISFITAVLEGFDGEVVIIGDILREALANRDINLRDPT